MLKQGAIGLAMVGVAWIMMPGDKTARSTAGEPRSGNTKLVATGDPAMERAREKARAGLDGFLQRARNPSPSDRNFTVKVKIRDGEHTEHMWVAAVQEEPGGRFKGRLDNRPEYVKTVRSGDTIRFGRDEITDWMFVEGKTIRGNYTACALLATRPAAEQAEMKAKYGLACQG